MHSKVIRCVRQLKYIRIVVESLTEESPNSEKNSQLTTWLYFDFVNQNWTKYFKFSSFLFFYLDNLDNTLFLIRTFVQWLDFLLPKFCYSILLNISVENDIFFQFSLQSLIRLQRSERWSNGATLHHLSIK